MAWVLFLILMHFVASEGQTDNLKLEQVLILSRHHVRSPLVTNIKDYTTKIWPPWDLSTVGFLTLKGYKLEGYLAEYISKWLEKENLLNGCPDEEDVLIRPNTKPRTISTAQAFVESAFPNCTVNIRVLSEEDRTHGFDSRFYPIYHNKSDIFKQMVKSEMETMLKKINLTTAYSELNRILDIANSKICERDGLCDLNKGHNTIVLEDDEEPHVKGPLSIATNAVDSFTMAYYEGMPPEDIAWGQLTTEDQWKTLSEAIRVNQQSRFNSPTGSKDISAPLLKYMKEIFESGIKFALLVGHDSNLNPVINALEFNDYELPDTYEPFPIGGKLVFQKLTDNNGRSFLKVEYIYQGREQIRSVKKLSLDSPPRRILMTLKNCKRDEGLPMDLCPWDEFISILDV